MALVWSALTFFAELVPRLGTYLMSIPPILVALSIDPFKALFVLLFHLALNETTGNLVLPRVRAATMNIRPVWTLFLVLAMASTFGLAGALIATPMAGFIKANDDEFSLSRYPEDPLVGKRVDTMLNRRGIDSRGRIPRLSDRTGIVRRFHARSRESGCYSLSQSVMLRGSRFRKAFQ